jgi:hypothetical protein
MLSLGSLAFATPWMLTALAAVPVLWWLMRVTPPAPIRTRFPAIRLLFGLRSDEETPAKTPWWLMALRIAVAVLVILALAHPILNPGARLKGEGTVLLVVDDGWAAAAAWDQRTDTLMNLLGHAERATRPVALLTTAPRSDGAPMAVQGILPAPEARELVQGLAPKPWPVDREAAAAALAGAGFEGPVKIFWLTDGLGAGDDGNSDAAQALAAALENLGPVEIIAAPDSDLAVALSAPVAGAELQFVVRRVAAEAANYWLRITSQRGQILAREQVFFGAGERQVELSLDLPPELRNRIARAEIELQNSAGAVALLDERWRRRPVGLVTIAALEGDQPLLSPTFYLERALNPFAEVRNGDIATLLERDLSVLALADVGKIAGPDRNLLDAWIDSGGVLVRFAGPKLAQDVDDLVPVQLRPGQRALGGAMAWTEPARLAPFPEASPFAGLVVPGDVLINAQVLAEPTVDIGEHTWARLEDGTPLVTGARHGDGWLVLFHTTANTDWSNLPLSGLFVEMLQSLVRLSQGVLTQGDAYSLPPLSSLDGFGRLGAPTATARPAPSDTFADLIPNPRNPPGFYGLPEARQALNLGSAIPVLAPLEGLPRGTEFSAFNNAQETDLLPSLLTAALILVLVELMASMGMRGLLRATPGTTAKAGLVLVALVGLVALAPVAAMAQAVGDDAFALEAALRTHLAYVRTGDRDVDEMSARGLLGLTRVMAARTSVEAANPIGINPEVDELTFFPILYWPMTSTQPELSPQALASLDAYMRFGGTILFDTRDQPSGGFSVGGVGPGTQVLRRILGRLDVPPLAPVDDDHILTKAFYLLDEFPGRWTGGQVWVEQATSGANDGVSSLIIGAHDWAAAWALGDDGWPLAVVEPGGERQREMAFRFGINLVMYMMTGNYKADQVHLPTIMERLGE